MSRGIIRGKPATNSIRGKSATDASTARTLANPASSLAITIDLQRLTGRIYLSPNQASKKATPSPDKSAYRNLAFAGFPHDDNPVSQDLTISQDDDNLCSVQGSTMPEKKIIAWAVVISVGAALVSRRPQIMAYYEVHKLAREDHLLSVVPERLSDTSVSANQGTMLSYFGYQYEVPWTDIVKVNQSGTMVAVAFKSGEALVFFDPASAPDGAKIISVGAADPRNVLSVFGPEAMQSNYALASTILNLTPKRISLWISPREAAGTAILLGLKRIYTANAETGLFSVKTSGYRGYQRGDPQRARNVDLSVFDDQDHEFHFQVGTAPGKPLTITQPDINRILDTLRPVPISERQN